MLKKKEKDFTIPYFIEMRTRESWSPAMRDIANECIEKIKNAKTYDEKEHIAKQFEKWIEDSPEIQY